MTDPSTILEELSGRHARTYAAAFADLFAAVATENKAAKLDALAWIADVTHETMGVGEVLGATITLRAAARVLAPTTQTLTADRSAMLAFADLPDQTVLPRVTLAEALQDMVDRTPVTIRNSAERTAQRIAQLYSERHAMAFVHAAEASVTREAQSFVARAFREGLSEGRAGRGLAMAVDEVRKRSQPWTEAYARMAFRTNVNTAVTAGRFRQAQDPAIRQVIPAFRFDAVGDADTRDNHDAMDGVILRADNPTWSQIAPPLGYNCRCIVVHVSRPELEDMGRIDSAGNVVESKIPPGARPDEGFRHAGRPDLFLTG